MRTDTTRSCDVPICAAEVTGHIADVAKQLVAGGWCYLRLEAIGASWWASLCMAHGHAVARGDRGALIVGRKGWTEDRGMVRATVLAEDSAVCAVDRCPTVAVAGGASLWSELRLETVALPGASYVCRLCPAHVRALLAGTRLSIIAGRWIEDVETTRELDAALPAPC
jgi:hypothetical protein